MSKTKENLQAVLENVIQNRSQLSAQLDGIPAQVEALKDQLLAGEVQIAKFDTLIAALQVASNDETIIEATTQQESANALFSPSGPEAAPVEAASGALVEPAQVDAEVTPAGTPPAGAVESLDA